MAKYLLNSWAWNMVRPSSVLTVKHDLSEEEFNLRKEGSISCIGHKAIARLLGVPCNREHIKLNVGDVALIVTTSNKLPYDALSLPEGTELRYECVKILEEI